MKSKISIMFLLFVLLTCSTGLAAENTSVIPSVGTLVFPSDIEVFPSQTPNSFGNILIANDNGILRTDHLIFKPLEVSDRNKIKNNLSAYNEWLNQSIVYIVKDTKSVKLLTNTPIYPPTIDNEQLAIKEAVILSKGIPLHLNYYLINSSEGLTLMIEVCSDSDSDYWKPIIAKMIADIKR